MATIFRKKNATDSRTIKIEQFKEIIYPLLDSGILESHHSQVTLHFDHNGVLRNIETKGLYMIKDVE
jgi:hypothetical protein